MTEEAERKPPRVPLGGRLAWWPFAVALSGAAVLVVVVVLVNAFAGGGTTGSRQQGTGLTSGGAVACPEFYEHPTATGSSTFPWVPATPAGVPSKKKLVPKLHPTHVTVCAYLDPHGVSSKSLRLTGQRVLTGRLDDVADTLRPLPAAAGTETCAVQLPPGRADQYLIGLRYAEAIVWVSAPAEPCAGAGNGVFRTGRNLSSYARAAYARGTWVSSPR